jgi:hypothetical protein
VEEIEERIPFEQLGQSSVGNLGSAVRVVHLVEDLVCAALGDEKEVEPCQWVLDTGATNHMLGSQAAFFGINFRIVSTVRFADGSVVFIEGVGIVVHECKNEEHRTLTVVYYIPRLRTNIISIGQLDECGYEVGIRGGVLSLRDENQRLLARIRRGPRRLYKVALRIARPVCLSAHTRDEAWHWHSCFGHVNFTSLMKMSSTEIVRGLPELDHFEQLCEACLAGKHRHSPFPKVKQPARQLDHYSFFMETCVDLSLHPHQVGTCTSYCW